MNDANTISDYLTTAELAAFTIDGVPSSTRPRPIERIGVIGAGTMGAGISITFLSAGLPVTLVETSSVALDRGTATVRRSYASSVTKGRITEQQADVAMGLLQPTLDFEALGTCDLIIEAVYENLDVKQEIFGRLDALAKPGALLASNTSYLSIDRIAEATQRPQDVLGLHFFSPANIMKLVEVVRGEGTADDVLVTAMAIARKIKKIAVVCRSCFGFIGNRMLTPRQDNAEALLLEGATPEQVDRVHTAFGMPIGPFQMYDLAGVDIGWHRDPTTVTTLREALCAAGRWGQKASAGYYDYDEKRKPVPSPIVSALIAQFRDQANIQARIVSDEEIVVRTLYTMVNEAAQILVEGVAQRPSDIDVVWINGYGWPRDKGGPIFWADQIGPAEITRALIKYAGRLGDDFAISPALAMCAADGSKLGALRLGANS